MTEDAIGVGHNSNEALRAFIERVERLNEDKAAIAEDTKEVFAEAKAAGFDAKIMRKVIARRKIDKATRDEQDALIAMYERVFG